jgi:O-antigen/teichoic acid export membrane protein
MARFYPESAREGRVGRLRADVGRILRRTTGLLVGLILVGGGTYALSAGLSYWAFVALACLVAVEVAGTFETGLLGAARRQKPVALWRGVEAWARSGLSAATVLVLGATPQAVLGGYFLGSAAALLFLLLAFSAVGTRPETAADHHNLTGALHAYALPLVPLGVVGWINALSDRYILGGLAGAEAVGIYAAAYGLVGRPITLAVSVVLATIRPAYFEAVAGGEAAVERKTVRAWVWMTIAICVLGVAAVALLNETIAALFLAERYRFAADIMPVLALGFSLMSISQVLNCVSLAYKRPELVVYSEGGAALASVVLGVPLIWAAGVHGAAMTTALAYLVQAVLAYYLSRGAVRRNGRPALIWETADGPVC